MENDNSENKSNEGGESKPVTSFDVVIPIKESREAKNDLIICCKEKNSSEKNEITIKRFGVEKAVLAWQSIFFDTMFDSCDKSIDEGQIQLPEQADVVETFLKCMYSVDSDPWTFDLCIDIIEMARNYEAQTVERQAYFRLCAAFDALSEKKTEHSMYTRYGRLYILKFMQSSRQAQEGKFAEATFLVKALKEKSNVILKSCGMTLATELHTGRVRYCPHCKRTGEVDVGIISGSNFSIHHLFTVEERCYFSINELLEFKLCLIVWATSNDEADLYDHFVNRHF